MAVGCGAKCAKVMLILFNFIFWLSGAGVLGVGIWLKVDKNIVKMFELINVDSRDPLLDYAAYVLIGIGAFVFIVGFFGCCGAIKESKCLLGLYIFLLFLVMAGELAAGIIALLYKDDVISDLEESLTEKIQDKYQANNTVAVAVDFAQIYFECCGVAGPDDWKTSQYNNETSGREVPFSCCKRKDAAKDTDALDITPNDVMDCKLASDSNTYEAGCKDEVENWVEQHAVILIGVGIGVACLELFGFIFAICLCRNVGEEA